MRILVVGASNSLLVEGYIRRMTQVLRANVGEALKIVNISVGGTSTITGISRVLEMPEGETFDIVLYEYLMNDAGHFLSRPNGAFIQRAVIQLLIGALAERYPDAVLAPLTFAMKPFFAIDAPNRVYDAQKAVWTATQTRSLDLRETFSYLYAKQAPEWLYSDPSHYSIPYATDLIGSLVARTLLELHGAPKRQTLAELNARVVALPQALPVRLRRLSAEAMAERAYGNCETVVRANSVMSASALRIRPGGGVKLAEVPFNISVLSDRNHDWARLARGDGARAQSWPLSTRFVGVDNPVANPPDKDRFFYSGIPLPLVFGKTNPFDPDAALFELGVEASTVDVSKMLAFDAFQTSDLGPDADRRLDIAGMTFLEAL